MLTAFFGALSILLTAPPAGVVLAAIARERKLNFWRFAGLYCLVSLPALAFQLRYYSVSILPSFLGASADHGGVSISAILVCASFYALYPGILYLTARADLRRTFVVAAMLFSVTLVIAAKAIVR